MEDQIRIYGKDSLLITETDVYNIELLFLDNNVTLRKNIAYIDHPYFYLYRGECTTLDYKEQLLEVGIYWNTDKNEYVIIEPSTDEDKALYSYEDKILSVGKSSIVEMINNRKVLLVSVPEAAKTFIPTIGLSDDILKRLLKQALLAKDINIDKYRSRFANKNELFNLKQSLKKDANLSMLLFNRGCEALNLRYTIILEELDGAEIIGIPLTGPITASSEDAYDV